ncbi:MAG: WbqC family protein, partial [Elusimicrobiales bacterium]|nr:WbqC family protein [Elusimicrobiales bacterium]
KGKDKVLHICNKLGATEYFNAVGGQELYDKAEFAAHGIKLYFLQTNAITYKQFKGEFVPNLSILDVMMFNPPQQIKNFLNDCTLI